MAVIAKPWPSESIIDLLVQKSSGQFIYASTVIKFVDDEYSRPTDRLDAVLHPVDSDLAAFADLDQLYHQILSTAHNTDQLLRILGAIILLRVSPTSNLIENLLCLKYQDVGLTLHGLHSLLHIPNPNAPASSPIRFHHASLIDFLKNESRSRKFFISVGVYHADLARCCLRLVTEWDFRSEKRWARNES
jgi:hypothetical protein